MTPTEQKNAAKKFVETWTGKIEKTAEGESNERQFCQLFWTTLLSDVFEIEDVAQFINFEKSVPKEFSNGKNFIDGYINSTKVLIEQKASKIDLKKGELQSDGQYLTPYQQAKRYGTNQNYSERPRWIIVSNFVSFEIHDMDKIDSQPYVIELKDLPNELHNLSMLYDTGKKEIKEEMALSVEAGKIVDELYEILAKKYNNSPAHQRSLNMLCVRLIFLLYADDAELLGRRGIFHSFIESYAAENLSEGIKQLFAVLNVKEDERADKFFDLPEKFSQFPYVNGNLFSETDNLIPNFNDEIRKILLEKGNFNWKNISPTIFGAVFESTLNPETRHDGGMHYTSIENIHKVIDPLFLNDLYKTFEEIKNSKKSANLKKIEFQELQDRIASIRIFDPACGSGNFLTESFLSLRRLENKILKELENDGFFIEDYIKISIQQFYGIEINDFAVSVAKTALWIAEAQMFEETTSYGNKKSEFFPLETYTNIREGNALSLDWKEIFTPAKQPDSEFLYIIGNPPFLGARIMNENQKNDVLSIFGEKLKGVGNLDYVSCWYKKCADLMKGTKIRAALVSTNSITQGEQPAILFKPLFNQGLKINFAHRTFKWGSESIDMAHVHCVIIGFSYIENKNKVIFNNKVKIEAENINAYLLDAPNVFIENRKKPLCNVSEIVFGSMPNDGGNFILSEEESLELKKKNPVSEKYIKLFLGAEEFINNKKRYCLWLKDANPKDLISCKEIIERVENVKELRRNSTRDATKKLAETPTLFGEIRQPESDYLIIPRVSSERRRYIPMGFLTKETITGDSAQILPNASLYDFGILTSNVHNAWMRAVCGRLKSDYRYSNTIVYNNFPWPVSVENGGFESLNHRTKIEETAQKILDAREKYSDSSLGEMYSNLLLYPELNKAHQENDKAVMAAYGFPVKMTESECVAELFKLYEKLVSEES